MQRRCCYCKLIKDHTEFTLNKQKYLGRSYVCYPCRRIYCRTHKRQDYKGKTDYFKKYRLEHKDKILRQINDWKLKNKEKIRAHGIANYAYEHGKIIKTPCKICGDVNSEMHHEDYSKPLEIIWLCRTHHGETRRKE